MSDLIENVKDVCCDHRLAEGLTGSCGHCYEARGIYIAELEADVEDLQCANDAWKVLVGKREADNERLRAIEKHARALLDGAGDEAVHHLKAALQERE